MPELLTTISPGLLPLLVRPRWLVGYSGGLDSTVLLHLLNRFLQQHREPPALLAIHIHHGLSPDAQTWQQHCETFCKRQGIALACRSIVLPPNQPEGLEAAARRARYDAIDGLRQPDDVLFLGHHLDDQLETLVLNLFRSRGIAGLAGMAAQSHPAALRVRPLLACTRAELRDYACQNELHWVEDESNRDVRFSRSFVRHRLLPTAAVHWPDYSSRLAATMRDLHHASELLDEVAAADLAAAGGTDRWGRFLDAGVLADISEVRARNLLRLWLHRCNVPMLRQRQWRVLYGDLLASTGSGVMALRGGSLRRFRQAIYFVPGVELAEPPTGSSWDGYERVGLGPAGALRWSPGHDRGLDPQREYRVAFRTGGEVFQPSGSRHSKSLKRFLQEQGVPPWWRNRVPLLLCNGQLAAVADLAIAACFVCSCATSAAQLVWEPQGNPGAG